MLVHNASGLGAACPGDQVNAPYNLAVNGSRKGVIGALLQAEACPLANVTMGRKVGSINTGGRAGNLSHAGALVRWQLLRVIFGLVALLLDPSLRHALLRQMRQDIHDLRVAKCGIQVPDVLLPVIDDILDAELFPYIATSFVLGRAPPAGRQQLLE